MHYITKTTLDMDFFERNKKIYTQQRKIRRLIVIPSVLFIFAIAYAVVGYLFANYGLICGAAILVLTGAIVFLIESVSLRKFPQRTVNELKQKLKDKELEDENVIVTTVFEDNALKISSVLQEEQIIPYKSIYDAKVNNNVLVVYVDEHKKIVCEGFSKENMDEIITRIKTKNHTLKN